MTSRSSKNSSLKDLKFLEKLRAATLDELEEMLLNHSGKKTPRWKRVAIRARIARLRPASQEWVHSLQELDDEARGMHDWQVKLLEESKARLRTVKK